MSAQLLIELRLHVVAAKQTGEMGLRIALGARPSNIFRMVVGWGVKLVAVGLLLALMGALVLTRFLEGALYGVRASGPTFGLVALLLVVVALAACYVPARRATKVDPMIALRHE